MKAEQISSIKILKQNKFYRIADLFYRDGNRWEHDRKEILKNPIYKNTILYDYLSQKTTESDFNLFKKIALSHANKYETKPKHDELVFHLRLGDAFDKNGKDRINNRIDWSRLQYKVFFRRNREMLEKLDEVTVVTAMHFGPDEFTGNYYFSQDCVDESISFLNYFSQRLNKFGCKIKIISNENIDQDICYIMQAKHFVPGMSKFSTLLSACIQDNAKLYREPIVKYI
mgnify:CR=1 FL=1